jgi:Na+/melibiose symporter-like transporter
MTTTTRPSRAERRETKRADPAHIGFGHLVAWSSSHTSQAVNFLVLSFFAIYCTDTLGLSAGIVGALLFASKLVEAFGMLFAGYMVDVSPNTRFGKARPFDLFIVAIWVATAFTFAVPNDLGTVAKYVWVFAGYLLVTSVFTPLFLANQPLYMARSFKNREAYTKVSSLSGIVIGVGALIVGIAFPIFIQQIGKSPSGWTILVLAFGVVFTAFGLLRFLFIKEKYAAETPALPKLKLKDIRTVLATNPYLWILTGIQFVIAFFANFGALTYYFRYVVGNVAIQGLLGFIAVLLLPLLALMPRLVKRYTASRLIVVCSFLGAAGFMIYLFAGGNIALLIIASVLTAICALPVSFLLPVLVIDNSMYNEWKGNRRLESVGGGLTSFAMYLGAGVSAGVTGLVLSMVGYDGTHSTQQPAAIAGIVALNSYIPAALAIVSAFLAIVYGRFERRLPAITASVQVQRANALAAVAGSGIGAPSGSGSATPLATGTETLVALEADELPSDKTDK